MQENDKEFYNNLSKRDLSEQEIFEAKKSFVGFFDLLYQIDRRISEEGIREKRKNDKAVCSAGST